jgi:hypothetical protein
MLFYISLPSWSNIKLCTMVDRERFSVFRVDNWVQKSGHPCPKTRRKYPMTKYRSTFLFRVKRSWICKTWQRRTSGDSTRISVVDVRSVLLYYEQVIFLLFKPSARRWFHPLTPPPPPTHTHTHIYDVHCFSPFSENESRRIKSPVCLSPSNNFWTAL